MTFNEGGFDAFPMLDYQGRRLIWASTRNSTSRNEINLFIADWLGPKAKKQAKVARRNKNKLFKNANRNITATIEDEKHLKNIKQLTFGGQNAEGYFR